MYIRTKKKIDSRARTKRRLVVEIDPPRRKIINQSTRSLGTCGEMLPSLLSVRADQVFAAPGLPRFPRVGVDRLTACPVPKPNRRFPWSTVWAAEEGKKKLRKTGNIVDCGDGAEPTGPAWPAHPFKAGEGAPGRARVWARWNGGWTGCNVPLDQARRGERCS